MRNEIGFIFKNNNLRLNKFKESKEPRVELKIPSAWGLER